MSQSVPADADPRLFWNGQYLLEDDPDVPANYSKAALEAQRAKWLALMQNRGPSKTLPLEMIPEDGSKPPLYHYGIPFTDRYMLEYAKSNHLSLQLRPGTREPFGGKSEFVFADLTPEDEEDKDFMADVLIAACFSAVCHIQKRCGITLQVARPFSLEWDGMISLWSNYDVNERCLNAIRTPERFQAIVKNLKEAMHEDGQESDIEWWYEWSNPVGLFTDLACRDYNEVNTPKGELPSWVCDLPPSPLPRDLPSRSGLLRFGFGFG